jgi:WAS family protein 1
LFNTPENPYKKYISLDNLSGKEARASKKDDDKKESKLADAPKTFLEGDVLPAISTIDYGYKPVLGEVPELHLPSVLPNLPNIADISWSVQSGITSIAPSFITPDLPSLGTL